MNLVFTLFLWPYIRRTNEQVYSQFPVIGQHQSLQLRAVLKRNIESVRALYPAFTWHAVSTVVNVGAYLVGAQIMQSTGVVGHTAIVSFFIANSPIRIILQLHRETMGLVLRSLIMIYGCIYPVLVIKRYGAIMLRMKIVMPRVARLLDGKKIRKISLSTANGGIELTKKAGEGDKYWTELGQMWTIA